MLEPGEWSIAIADLSGVHPSPTGGASTGQAVLDVGIFQIGSDGRAPPSMTPGPFPTPPKTSHRESADLAPCIWQASSPSLDLDAFGQGVAT
jgi:hypothetical protein